MNELLVFFFFRQKLKELLLVLTYKRCIAFGYCAGYCCLRCGQIHEYCIACVFLDHLPGVTWSQRHFWSVLFLSECGTSSRVCRLDGPGFRSVLDDNGGVCELVSVCTSRSYCNVQLCWHVQLNRVWEAACNRNVFFSLTVKSCTKAALDQKLHSNGSHNWAKLIMHASHSWREAAASITAAIEDGSSTWTWRDGQISSMRS